MNAVKNIIRQFEPTKVKVGEYQYLLYPFPAFKAANISGELFAFIAPAAASLMAIIPSESEKSIMDSNIEQAASKISAAFSFLDGNKVECMLEKLLIENQNIVIEFQNGEADYLTKELADNLFCGNAQLLYVLAYHVIKVNYEDFFKKVGILSGKGKPTEKAMMKFQNMAASMFPDSQS